MLSPSFLNNKFVNVTVSENSVGISNPSIASIVITPAPLLDLTSNLSYINLLISEISTSIDQFTDSLDVKLLIRYVWIPSLLKFTAPFSNFTSLAFAKVFSKNTNSPLFNHTIALSRVPKIFVIPDTTLLSSSRNSEIFKLYTFDELIFPWIVTFCKFKATLSDVILKILGTSPPFVSLIVNRWIVKFILFSIFNGE